MHVAFGPTKEGVDLRFKAWKIKSASAAFTFPGLLSVPGINLCLSFFRDLPLNMAQTSPFCGLYSSPYNNFYYRFVNSFIPFYSTVARNPPYGNIVPLLNQIFSLLKNRDF